MGMGSREEDVRAFFDKMMVDRMMERGGSTMPCDVKAV